MWIGARNPVRIGSSCAAVTGYDFPGPIVRHEPDGEGGKKVGVADAMPKARSQNIRPLHLIRQRDAGPRFERFGFAVSLQADSGIRQSGSDREKTSSQKEE
jgi:hypothetical protein